MKYQVIARRYRPRTFEDVVGQESAGITLRNAIVQSRLAHAYLFAGPRGVGKTSMARIFAKALNCPRACDRSRPEAEWALPCDECEACRAIHAGEDLDVLEIDGASYRGIEDVRDIVENVKFTPARSPYKIFIIDEVHMLTREAFNALLKTLEEPPAHVKFVFATTEAHKIPETVLSRCQRFDFRPIGEADIVRRLEQICRGEAVEPEPGLLEKIARYGRGGLRDAQTLLDQAITFSQSDVAPGVRPILRAGDLERITGRLPEALIDLVAAAIESRDPAATLGSVGECFKTGADPAIFIDQVIERMRDGLRAAAVDGQGDRLDVAVGRLQVLHETALKLRSSPHPRLAVELALVKLARMEDPRALGEALAYLKSIEGKLPLRAAVPGAPAPPRAAVAPPAPSAPQPPGPSELRSASAHAAGSAPSPAAAADAFDFARLRALWDQVVIECRERLPQIAAFLSKGRLRGGREAGVFTLAVDSEFSLKQLREPRRSRELEALVREVTGVPWRMGLELDLALAEVRSPAPAGVEARPPPGGGNGRPAASRTAPASLKDDPLVQKSAEIFRGKIL